MRKCMKVLIKRSQQMSRLNKQLLLIKSKGNHAVVELFSISQLIITLNKNQLTKNYGKVRLSDECVSTKLRVTEGHDCFLMCLFCWKV